jgi:hypothetical protein
VGPFCQIVLDETEMPLSSSPFYLMNESVRLRFEKKRQTPFISLPQRTLDRGSWRRGKAARGPTAGVARDEGKGADAARVPVGSAARGAAGSAASSRGHGRATRALPGAQLGPRPPARVGHGALLLMAGDDVEGEAEARPVQADDMAREGPMEPDS